MCGFCNVCVLVICILALFSYPDCGFCVLFPHFYGNCQGKTRKDGARPALFSASCYLCCSLVIHVFYVIRFVLCMYCTVLHCTVLYCTVLYCTALHCTVLYCTALYCTTATGCQPNCSSPYTTHHNTANNWSQSVNSQLSAICKRRCWHKLSNFIPQFTTHHADRLLVVCCYCW